MGNRYHLARYPKWTYKRFHGTPSKWMKRWWNKKERRVQDRTLIRYRHDWDEMAVPPEHRISSLWDWY